MGVVGLRLLRWCAARDVQVELRIHRGCPEIQRSRFRLVQGSWLCCWHVVALSVWVVARGLASLGFVLGACRAAFRSSRSGHWVQSALTFLWLAVAACLMVRKPQAWTRLCLTASCSSSSATRALFISGRRKVWCALEALWRQLDCDAAILAVMVVVGLRFSLVGTLLVMYCGKKLGTVWYFLLCSWTEVEKRWSGLLAEVSRTVLQVDSAAAGLSLASPSKAHEQVTQANLFCAGFSSQWSLLCRMGEFDVFAHFSLRWGEEQPDPGCGLFWELCPQGRSSQ